uniref:Uncharacterized protein n=1 Tax=Chelonoidis abingdonii TaxID=106734 RepID=A0A8C0GA95_CHEAB
QARDKEREVDGLNYGRGAGNPSAPGYNFAALVFGVFLILCVLGGNLLVCLSVCSERALKTTTNYFIVSLAVRCWMVHSGSYHRAPVPFCAVGCGRKEGSGHSASVPTPCNASLHFPAVTFFLSMGHL